MTLASVRAYFAAHAPDIEVIETEDSSATVPLAAIAHGVEPGQIAKTLCIKVGGEKLLLVTRGDARLDNKKAKAAFGGRPRMLGAEEVEALTGHKVGGVCPFGLPKPLPIYADVSLKIYDEVIPAGGSTHSSVRLSVSRLVTLTGARWVDACEPPLV
ncbi:YbaK/EbsC family protein [Devosia rhodophyticola]|uniref:YbaK/EbsC family protein n=1 Tax=Devosia rhodophyticola TaxID=3026423 RepID=A0ABY7YUS5_9HYPH|nr:YbaK/EbsC family protein [Devosia rhodophyticola]WDR04605.1 YbaK/EbsC family protein [Devosia rhodophyticola]